MARKILAPLRAAALVAVVAVSACGGGGASAPSSLTGGGGGVEPDSNPPPSLEAQVAALSGGGSDRDRITKGPLLMRWAYYVDPAPISQSSRWYISSIDSGGKAGVYSLMAINRTGDAGWATVGASAASVDLANEYVHVDSRLDVDPSDCYEDIGWRETACDAQIHADRRRIEGSSDEIRWYFFRAPDVDGAPWYIVLSPAYAGEVGTSEAVVERFSAREGDDGLEYDWVPVDTSGLTARFSLENGQKKCQFVGGGASAQAWKNVLRGGANTATHGELMRGYYAGSSCQHRTLLEIVERDAAPPPAWDFYMDLRHIGIDIAPRGDDLVHPIAPGTLIAKATGTSSKGYGGYGFWCIVQHHDSVRGDYQSLYGHFAAPALPRIGEAVELDSVLGTAGSTGTSEGVHVHLEVRRFAADAGASTYPYHPAFANAYGIETSGPTSACVQWDKTVFDTAWIDPKDL